jgi:hypothetical protein
MRITALVALIALLWSGSLAAAQWPTPEAITQDASSGAAAPAQGSQPSSAQEPQPGSTSAPVENTQTQPVLQQRSSAAATEARGSQVAAGTEVRATLDKGLSSKESKEGDRFTATISEPVRDSSGRQVIPAGSKIQGEVANVERGKTLPSVRGRGQLNLRFREITLPSGERLPITATLLSVNETSGGKGGAKAGEEGEVTDRTTGREVARDVGIGAAVGTVAGLIFGSALKGLAIGAIAGGGYVLATQGRDVNLPENTGLRLQLDKPVTLSASR